MLQDKSLMRRSSAARGYKHTKGVQCAAAVTWRRTDTVPVVTARSRTIQKVTAPSSSSQYCLADSSWHEH